MPVGRSWKNPETFLQLVVEAAEQVPQLTAPHPQTFIF